MNRSLVGFVAASVLCLPAVSSAQWIRHHQHHGLPNCSAGVVTWDFFVDLPQVTQVFQPFWSPLPTVVPQLDIFPASSVWPPQPTTNLDRGENFARKQIWLPARPIEVNQLQAKNFNDATEIRRRAAVLKRSSPADRMRADQSISKGDQAFAGQKLARATAQYRRAIAAAPDYAEAHFRLAHAYVATRQYNLALKSVLIALELSQSSRRDGFSLEDMYQGDRFPRQQHLKRLLDASLREPHDGGLQFLIGFTLHYDGQPELGQDYFQAAEDLAGIHQAYVSHFLPIKVVEEPQEAAN